MSKYSIIIVIIIVLAGFVFWLTSIRMTSTTSFEFVGTITSVQNRVLIMKGFYNIVPNQIAPGMLVAKDVTVAITPDTKILKQVSKNGTIERGAITFEKLRSDIQTYPNMLARVRSNYDFYNQPHIVAVELVYTTESGVRGVIK